MKNVVINVFPNWQNSPSFLAACLVELKHEHPSLSHVKLVSRIVRWSDMLKVWGPTASVGGGGGFNFKNYFQELPVSFKFYLRKNYGDLCKNFLS